MPTSRILGLLAVTVTIALTIALASFSVVYRENGIAMLPLATPLLLTVFIQCRFGLRWHVATGLHYLLSILWAFVFGVAYSLAWQRVPQDILHRDSVGLEDPLRFGIFAMQAMAIAGLASTAIYGLVSWTLGRSGKPMVLQNSG